MEKSKNEIVIVAEQSGLEKSKVEILLQNFNKHFSQAKEIVSKVKDIQVTDVSQYQIMQEAREARLSLKKIRVDVENTRKQLKEQSIREGKAIEGVANIIKALIIPVEEHLEKQEKFAEIKEAEIKAKRLADRVTRLSQYVQDVSLYNLNDMNDQAFENLLASSKKAFDDQKEAEQKEEKDRIDREKKRKLFDDRRVELAPYNDFLDGFILEEDTTEDDYQKMLKTGQDRKKIYNDDQEKIRLENEKLKKEKEDKDKQLAKERETNEAKLKKEREAREKIETKIREDKEADEKKIKEEEEKKRKALLDPDKMKLLEFSNILEKIELPNVKNREAGRVIDEAQTMIYQICTFLREKAKGF